MFSLFTVTGAFLATTWILLAEKLCLRGPLTEYFVSHSGQAFSPKEKRTKVGLLCYGVLARVFLPTVGPFFFASPLLGFLPRMYKAADGTPFWLSLLWATTLFAGSVVAKACRKYAADTTAVCQVGKKVKLDVVKLMLLAQ